MKGTLTSWQSIRAVKWKLCKAPKGDRVKERDPKEKSAISKTCETT
jgi:hypothetical protein